MPYTYPRFPHHPPPRPSDSARVVIAGGGVVGLTLALDLAQRGVACVLLDEDDTVSHGSRAICWAKRTLEIYGRLGLGQRFLEKGVTWNTGRVFHGEREAYAFDLLPEQGHEYPAFVNLQQYHAEEWLVRACEATGLVDLRWRHRVTSVENRADGAHLAIETPHGGYALHAEWLLACDGARSTVRDALGLEFVGQVFRDRFLIADVTMDLPFATERRFWFDPPFHPGQTVLLHRQADGEYRVDFQLGWEADPEAEKDPARLRARLAAMLGEEVAVEIGWVSVYSFRCRRIERFRHGRTLFLGDAAHQVSPFGARGGNGGVQDADNLGWKLAAVLTGAAPAALLDSYDAERVPAADENILHSTRSTDFITPKNEAARAYREAVLGLAADHAFARPLVNSGRLSRPAVLSGSPLSAADAGDWDGGVPAGGPAPDAPVLDAAGRPDWLLRHIGRAGGFTLLSFGAPVEVPSGVAVLPIAEAPTPGAVHDHSGLAAGRFGARPGDAVLLRPDQHVAARFRAGAATPAAIAAAHRRALGHAA
jgi:3-(3-hydroxy-phenyl)propionate hydroxylase